MTILGARDLTLRRVNAAGSWAAGRFVEGSRSDTTITGAFQPLNGQEIALLPEGSRASDHRKVLTETELRGLDQHEEKAADQVVVDSVVYKVMTVAHWPAILPHYEARLFRLQEAA